MIRQSISRWTVVLCQHIYYVCYKVSKKKLSFIIFLDNGFNARYIKSTIDIFRAGKKRVGELSARRAHAKAQAYGFNVFY